MTPAARYAAAIPVLDQILGGAAVEPVLAGWGRQNRYAGSKDRAALRDIVFDVLRAKRSLAALGGAETGRGLVLGLLRRDGPAPEGVFGAGRYAPEALTDAERAHLSEDVTFTPGEALDLPDWLIPHWRAALGDAAEVVAALGRGRGPVTLRVNRAKADRATAQAVLEADGIGTCVVAGVSTALIVERNPRRVMASSAYRDGLVELQDSASQEAMEALPLAAGDKVLDYCAGGGGKALAIWDRTRSPVVAHDADPRRMVDLPARAARAGAEVSRADADEVRRKGPYDLVLCDAPCSGSGTWRRTPRSKWELTAERLKELNRMQGDILVAASALVAPGGTLAYATCSVLSDENEAIVDAFRAAAPGWSVERELRLVPTEERDGFFLAVLTRHP